MDDPSTPSQKVLLDANKPLKRSRRWWCCASLILLIALLLIAAVVAVPVAVTEHKKSNSASLALRGVKAIPFACSATRFPQTCNSSLYAYPGALQAEAEGLTAFAVLAAIDAVSNTSMQCSRVAQEPQINGNATLAGTLADCSQLLGLSLLQLNASYGKLLDLSAGTSPQFEDLKASLSGAVTFQGSCVDGLSKVGITVDGVTLQGQGNYSTQVASNALAFVNALAVYGDNVQQWQPTYFQTQDYNSTGTPDRRRLLSKYSLSPFTNQDATQRTGIPSLSSALLESSILPSKLSLFTSVFYQTLLPKWLKSGNRIPLQPVVNKPYSPGKDKAAAASSFPYPSSPSFLVDDALPRWLRHSDRNLLEDTSTGSPSINVTVAIDGSGDYKTIQQAVDEAPTNSDTRYVIHIKAGVYDEIVRVSNRTQNLMFVGDGINATIITGNASVLQAGVSTFRTATVVVEGKGFIAKGVTFRNTAGAVSFQAVALRVSADQCAFWQCSMDAFQDTLWAHALRQFYKECIIYGTIDFVFGNAAAVFQGCTLLARTNLPGQQNVYTAQGRIDPGQNSGFSIQNCTLGGTPDLVNNEREIDTYLGRPWKLYSLVVYMKSVMSNVVNSDGWFPWSGDFALSTLYYAEYDNTGPGANTQDRVNWSTVITKPSLVAKFQAGTFLDADEWLPNTNIPYTSSV